ncbi:MAG: hypothetical protein KDD69_05845 [Bdellovibrionales bacterium]|nr:hypothetical protein [Bdellovibrionales bacterium]
MSSERTEARRNLELGLARLETMINELRIQYEQYFVDILPRPPEQLEAEVKRQIKTLLKAPFKNSADRFRLRTLVQRFQTYQTYWERVNKQREEGIYIRDIFKADLREKIGEEDARADSNQGVAERGMQQLFESYQHAARKAGAKADNLNYDVFKKSLMTKAKELKEKHGVKRVKYKVVVKDGKVTVKASGGE